MRIWEHLYRVLSLFRGREEKGWYLYPIDYVYCNTKPGMPENKKCQCISCDYDYCRLNILSIHFHFRDFCRLSCRDDVSFILTAPREDIATKRCYRFGGFVWRARVRRTNVINASEEGWRLGRTLLLPHVDSNKFCVEIREIFNETAICEILSNFMNIASCGVRNRAGHSSITNYFTIFENASWFCLLAQVFCLFLDCFHYYLTVLGRVLAF